MNHTLISACITCSIESVMPNCATTASSGVLVADMMRVVRSMYLGRCSHVPASSRCAYKKCAPDFSHASHDLTRQLHSPHLLPSQLFTEQYARFPSLFAAADAIDHGQIHHRKIAPKSLKQHDAVGAMWCDWVKTGRPDNKELRDVIEPGIPEPSAGMYTSREFPHSSYP